MPFTDVFFWAGACICPCYNLSHFTGSHSEAGLEFRPVACGRRAYFWNLFCGGHFFLEGVLFGCCTKRGLRCCDKGVFQLSGYLENYLPCYWLNQQPPLGNLSWSRLSGSTAVRWRAAVSKQVCWDWLGFFHLTYHPPVNCLRAWQLGSKKENSTKTSCSEPTASQPLPASHLSMSPREKGMMHKRGHVYRYEALEAGSNQGSLSQSTTVD